MRALGVVSHDKNTLCVFRQWKLFVVVFQQNRTLFGNLLYDLLVFRCVNSSFFAVFIANMQPLVQGKDTGNFFVNRFLRNPSVLYRLQ